MDTITLRRFDDMHCHFRVGDVLHTVLPYTAKYCGRAIVMPNTRPRAIRTAKDVEWYREQLQKELDFDGCKNFEPLMTIDVRDSTTPEMIEAASEIGVVAGKVYPLGVTTNSEEGLRDFRSAEITKTFQAMSYHGMILLLHGEIDQPRTLVTKREQVFLPTLEYLAKTFPNLQIVLEHITTKKAVDTVYRLGVNVAATITAHHLCLTLNDVIGSGLRPHNACMPTPKDFSDRDALLRAAFSGDPKYFLGSDSAPHLREKKECAVGACGVFSAPILPQLLTQIFEASGESDWVELLQDFTSAIGAEFYNLPQNEGTITLVRKPFQVPDLIRGIVPFKAGETLEWSLADS